MANITLFHEIMCSVTNIMKDPSFTFLKKLYFGLLKGKKYTFFPIVRLLQHLKCFLMFKEWD